MSNADRFSNPPRTKREVPSSAPAPGKGGADNATGGRAAVFAVAVLGCLFAAINLYYFTTSGVRVVGDGLWYVEVARQLPQGMPVPEMLRSRLGYLGLIAACQVSGLGLGGVVVVQLGFAVVACIALYDLGRTLAGPRAGVLAAATLAANPDIALWHWYILTDSLYISAVAITVWFIHAAAVRRSRWYVAAACALGCAALLRPNGWLLVAVALGYWAWNWPAPRAVRWGGLAGVGLAFVASSFLLLTLRPGLLTNDPDAMLRRGEVIWGYPEGRLAMPPDPESPPAGLPGALGYALHHPVACLRLAGLRIVTELAHARPYYSTPHNAFLIAFLAPLYVLALVGYVRHRRRPLAALLALVIGSHLLMQALNYADWSGRFLLYVLPLIGVLGACGSVQLGVMVWRRVMTRETPRPGTC